ncbi:hypothetical protein RND81_12G046400 [Saponaria officinalis]|uniref:RING-type domain-containing protein n=1 Tax=Saponaria officinalis TaxID=3572 RepID=A0AAW1H759_SAPOF
MISAISLLIMLLIMIIIPTILYTIFFLINCPPNPFHFFRHRSENSENSDLRRSKLGDQVEHDDDKNKDKIDRELIKMSTNLGKDKECSICLSGFVDGEELRQLKNCKHLFHKVCIDKWLSTHFNCPVCRAFAIHNHFKPQVKGVNGLGSSDFWQGLPDSA